MSWFLWVFRPEHPIYCSSCKLRPHKAPLSKQRAYPQYRMYCIDFTFFAWRMLPHSLAKGKPLPKAFFACHSLLEDMAFVNTKKGVSTPAEKDAVFHSGNKNTHSKFNKRSSRKRSEVPFEKPLAWGRFSTMIASWPWKKTNTKTHQNSSFFVNFYTFLTTKTLGKGSLVMPPFPSILVDPWPFRDGQVKWPLPSPAAQRRKRTHAARQMCRAGAVWCIRGLCCFFLVKQELRC